MLYLLRDDKRDYVLFKIGSSSDIEQRMSVYTTHNPEATLLEMVMTRSKSFEVERKIREEVLAMGYPFIKSANDVSTEWFQVPYEEADEFAEKGFKQFNACKKYKPIKITP